MHQQHLATLVSMLQRLSEEEKVVREADPVRANHLLDALADLRVLIARLEARDPAGASDRKPFKPEHPLPTDITTDPPESKRNASSGSGEPPLTV